MTDGVEVSISDDPPCRRCLSFKRKTHDAGICWNESVDWHGAMVSEHGNCERWTPKVIDVTRHVERDHHGRPID